MSGLKWRWQLVIPIALFLVVGSTLTSRSEVQEEKGTLSRPAKRPKIVPVKEGTTTPLPKVYYGIRRCQDDGCHNYDAANPRVQPKDDPLLCDCTEVKHWLKYDKHADAFKVLDKPRGKQMRAILKYDDALTVKNCLPCHGIQLDPTQCKIDLSAPTNKVQPLPSKDGKDPPVRFAGFFDIEEGVSCVVCHGSYNEWVVQHAANREEFRKYGRAKKEKNFGMIDLWDPVTRARLCASCHIGNLDEGKYVSHDMYAAGHPPLPGFEVASFSNMMPRHWKYLAEKPESVQNLIFKLSELEPDKAKIYNEEKRRDQEQAKMVLVGAAVSLAESMRVAVEKAYEAGEAKDPEDRMLDWATFDCWSCHHDLKSPSWRQQRGYAGKPGRIPTRDWPATLIPFALKALSRDSKLTAEDKAKFNLSTFEKDWQAVQRSYTVRQYGDLEGVKRDALALADWADALADRLNKMIIDKELARELLSALPTLYDGSTGKSRLLDYDGARQVSWAYQTMYDEQYSQRGTGTLYAGYDDSKRPLALQNLGKALRLSFPTMRMGDTGKEGVIVNNLTDSLDHVYKYDAVKFPEMIKSLLEKPGK